MCRESVLETLGDRGGDRTREMSGPGDKRLPSAREDAAHAATVGVGAPSTSRFTVFLGGQIFSLMGDGLAFLAIPLLVLELTSDPFAAALAAAPRTVGYLLFGLVAGAFVDRFNPRLIMLTMDLVRLSSFLGLALLAHTGDLQVWMVLALAFLSSGAGVFFETALSVAVRDFARGDRLVRANSWLEATNQASLIVGPGMFGVLSAAIGLNNALFANALTYLLSLVTLFIVGGRAREDLTPSPRTLGKALAGLRRDVADGFRFLRDTRLILLLTVLQASANLFVAVETLIPFYARNILGVGDSTLGVVVAVGGLGGVLGAAVAPRLGTPRWQLHVVAVSAVCLGAALAGIGLIGGVISLVVCNVLVTGPAILAVVVIRTVRQELVPRDMLGRVTATARMAALAASPLGALIAGTLAGLGQGDPRPVFVGFGLLTVITVVVVWCAGLREHAVAARRRGQGEADHLNSTKTVDASQC
jgi:MFS family permease